MLPMMTLFKICNFDLLGLLIRRLSFICFLISFATLLFAIYLKVVYQRLQQRSLRV